MLKYVFIISSLFLTGCDKLMPIPFWGNTTNNVNNACTNTPVTVLVLGDSQGILFSENGGLSAFYSCFSQVTNIDCAKHGAKMHDWDLNGDYWDECIEESNEIFPNIVVLSMGANDAQNPPSEAYSSLMLNLLTRIRTQWPTAKVFYLQTGDNNSTNPYPYWNYIQEQESYVNLNDCKMISTKGLATRPPPDGLHWSDASLVQIGQRIIANL